MVPLREDLLIMLGASGLTDLIASGTLQLEADLIMAARCKTHCTPTGKLTYGHFFR